MFLIVGLGNPGQEYLATRHNAGFLLMDRLSASYGIKVKDKACGALCGRGLIEGHDVALAKPQTYMNRSGSAVADLLDFFGCRLEDLIVISDDCDLALGRIRIRPNGGSGGHRGMASIISILEREDFTRIRLGIGRPLEGDITEYVLSPFMPDEGALLVDMLSRAEGAVAMLVKDGIEQAMNAFN
ncbi:MAG: aminoacyl-tRNA hydrolase [Deltaproteobacteria bacterium]|nr:aminoacyl-tRNA hydrolase [Deltaproteobacteria bacterium]